ncbi:hypothetical protein JCM10207_003937 [Rhodosporidiobolus poonsookiae]
MHPLCRLANLLALLVVPSAALFPTPRTLTKGSDVVKLSPHFEIVLASKTPPEDLLSAIDNAKEQLQHDSFSRLIVGRGETDRSAVESADTLAGLFLSLSDSSSPRDRILSISDEINKPYDELDEAYSLQVPAGSDGSGAGSGKLQATLTANTTLGLARGLQTFTQLVYKLPGEHGELYIPEAPISIEDSPAFPHRGFMLDTSRNFFPVKDILRTLDAMASVKLNGFHWHATDSQSWPLFIPSFPDLSAKGAYSAAEVYSWDDVQLIQSHANGLGISVLLEIDMPGHTASIAQAFPEHIACSEAEPWAKYAVEPPAGQLRLDSNATLSFAQELVRSASGLLASKYFSTGGDEINEACYAHEAAVSRTATLAKRNIDELLGPFVQSLHTAVRETGKTPVVWEEMVLEHPLDLEEDVVVIVWINSEHVASVAETGHRIIHGASDYLYLDCGEGGWLANHTYGNSWCDPFKTWQKIYSFDPFSNLTESQKPLVLGGQSLLWAEQASPENLDSLAWPRAASAAEVFWTGGSLADGTRDVAEALPRLHDWRYRAVARGIKAAPLQPHYCALRPQACNLGG